MPDTVPIECAQCAEYAGRIADLEDRNQSLASVEDTLQRNGSLFLAMLSRSKDGILLTGPSRNVVHLVHSIGANDPASVRGMQIEMLIHPDDRAIMIDCYRQVLENPGTSAEFEVRAFGPTGSPLIWVQGIVTDMLDEPNVQAIICNYWDRTRQREQELRLAEFAAIVERIEYVTFSTDAGGKILTWNPGAEKSTGYSAQEIVGRDVSILVPADLLEHRQALRRGVCETGFPAEYATEGLHKTGARIPILLQLAPIPDRYGRVQAVAHISKRLA